MLPADLDDEQRAHLAHEHPTDLDSTPSSPSSGVHTFVNPRRRPKSASHHRSRTTDESSSSHLLARLVSREEEVREINAALAVTSERLEAESSRANAAERRALDYFHRLRIATENRERAEQESARLREELKLYKLQLENAQKEIFRAQDIIDQVASQRNEAEAEAARARTKARKLQEEKLVMFAREEGRRMGYKEGLSIGRRIGYDEGRGRWVTGPSDQLPYHPLSLEGRNDDDNVREHEEDTTDEERDDPRSRIQLRSVASIRQQPMRSDSAPLIRSPETARHVSPLPIPSRINPVRARTPSHEHRTPSSPHESDEPETIHPIPIRPSPIIPARPVNAHPDGWIPRVDFSHILHHRATTTRTAGTCSHLTQFQSRPRFRTADLGIHQSQPQSPRLSGRATMLIRRPFRHLFQLHARPRLHPVLRPISRNMIW
ncbi:hypothetical protein J3R83DRAFT_1481 [Lanmaoa asiatica]|nr:hypothetical protein J3R83DRAFT_1481 [Lanmaoa asiatica]